MSKSRIRPHEIVLASILVTMVAILSGSPGDSNWNAIPKTADATIAVTPGPTATPGQTATPAQTATPTSSPRPTPSPTPIACDSGNQYTFVNKNSYPVWLGEEYQGVGDLAS